MELSMKKTGRKTQSQKTGAIIKSMEMEILGLRAQLTDANETIRQNRLTIERLQNLYDGEKILRVNGHTTYKEIALNLSRALSGQSSVDDKSIPAGEYPGYVH